jgi:hypothetical protein
MWSRISRPEGLDPAGSINTRHHSVGDRELALAIGAGKPPTAFAARLRVIDTPRAMPLGDLIRCGAKVAAQTKKVLTHTRYSTRYSYSYFAIITEGKANA